MGVGTGLLLERVHNRAQRARETISPYSGHFNAVASCSDRLWRRENSVHKTKEARDDADPA